MLKPRLIARLDIKAPNLVKGIQLEGLRVMGDPEAFAIKYYEQGIDELLYIDIVASLYNRNSLSDIIKKTARNIFIPITVGGGIRSVDDATQALRSGADKVAINTAAVANPQLITQIAERFGSQCMVLSVEAKRNPSGKGWEAFTDNGREHTHLDAVEWVQRAVELGAGEILLTSVDQEGRRKGMDTELIKAVTSTLPVPVIASGGLGDPSHLKAALEKGQADAVAVADALHYGRHSVGELKDVINAHVLAKATV